MSFEPYYENYGPDAILAGAIPRYVTLHPPHWTFDEAQLRQAFNANTKAIIINTPHNPTGKVFTREELTLITELFNINLKMLSLGIDFLKTITLFSS